jgi:hypothetical protein
MWLCTVCVSHHLPHIMVYHRLERGRNKCLALCLDCMYGEYWFRLSHLSMMVIGSFASYTKTKSVESAV